MAVYIGEREEIREFQGRYPYFRIALLFAFTVLLIRSWYLQILKGDYFFRYSQQNSLKQQKIPAPRGIIFDRNRDTLVDSSPSFDITWTPQYVTDVSKTVLMVSSLLKMPKEEIEAALEKEKKLPRFYSRVIKKDASRDEIAWISARRFELPGIDIEVAVKRVYHDKSVGAHLYGFIGEINEKEIEELNRQSFQKYQQGDVIGKFGLEERWEEYLRGIDGATYKEVDAFGRETSEGGGLFDYLKLRTEPTPGKNLVLTIDHDLQLTAAKLFVDKKGRPKPGALVALDPESGEILAMHSQPGFDPTEFSRGIDFQIWQAFLGDENKPLLDKTIQDGYPPGSTFKLVTATAGLEANVLSPDESVNCNGHYFLGRGHFRCWTWRKGGHGIVDLKKAIRESCDVYFYRAGVKAGVDRLAEAAKMYGMGTRTGVNMRGEIPGIVPSTAWKRERFGQEWLPGETPSIAIGQGYLTVSVLQLARLYMSIANGGKLHVPFVVKRIEEPTQDLIREFQPKIERVFSLKADTLKRLREGLYAVVNEPGGTAYFSGRADGYDIAGKTGTSQVIRISKSDRERKCEELPFKYRDHAWFVGFAPVDQPKIVVAVSALHDCHPYNGATQIVRDVIKAYLKDRLDFRVIRGASGAKKEGHRK